MSEQKTSVLSSLNKISNFQETIRKNRDDFQKECRNFVTNHMNELLDMEEKERFVLITRTFTMFSPYIYPGNPYHTDEQKKEYERNYELYCSTEEVRELADIFTKCFPEHNVIWGEPTGGSLMAEINIRLIDHP